MRYLRRISFFNFYSINRKKLIIIEMCFIRFYSFMCLLCAYVLIIHNRCNSKYIECYLDWQSIKNRVPISRYWSKRTSLQNTWILTEGNRKEFIFLNNKTGFPSDSRTVSSSLNLEYLLQHRESCEIKLSDRFNPTSKPSKSSITSSQLFYLRLL